MQWGCRREDKGSKAERREEREAEGSGDVGERTRALRQMEWKGEGECSGDGVKKPSISKQGEWKGETEGSGGDEGEKLRAPK